MVARWSREVPGATRWQPAALGSAIVHGPDPGPYPEAYARRPTDAFAARRVASGPDLADAITDLIAPDKAAFLAHNAWAAASGGAEVTERVMRLLFGLLGSGSDAPAPKAKASSQGNGCWGRGRELMRAPGFWFTPPDRPAFATRAMARLTLGLGLDARGHRAARATGARPPAPECR